MTHVYFCYVLLLVTDREHYDVLTKSDSEEWLTT